MRVRDKGTAAGMLILAMLLLVPAVVRGGAFASPGDVTIRQAGQYPAGVTAEKIAAGKPLFETARCVNCHGPDGKGKPEYAEDMTDGTWKFAKEGTFDALVKVIKEGLPRATTGARAMPAAALRQLTDEQVGALAAYSWSLNQKKN